MNLKTRLRKLEKAAPTSLRLKDPRDMTDAELDAEIERVNDMMRRVPGGAEFLARLKAVAPGKGDDQALRSEIEFLESELKHR